MGVGLAITLCFLVYWTYQNCKMKSIVANNPTKLSKCYTCYVTPIITFASCALYANSEFGESSSIEHWSRQHAVWFQTHWFAMSLAIFAVAMPILVCGWKK